MTPCPICKKPLSPTKFHKHGKALFWEGKLAGNEGGPKAVADMEAEFEAFLKLRDERVKKEIGMADEEEDGEDADAADA